MKKLKRILCLLLCLAMFAAMLSACVKNTAESTDSTDVTGTEQIDADKLNLTFNTEQPAGRRENTLSLNGNWEIQADTKEEETIIKVGNSNADESVTLNGNIIGMHLEANACKKLNSYEEVAAQSGDSRNQIHRYIRLTHLIPELLDWMDEGKIALSVGVELSYLNEDSQREVLEQCEINDCTPSYSQAWRMHKADRESTLSYSAIRQIMQEEKANQKEMFKIPMERIRRFFPQSYTPAQIEENILRLCEQEHRRRMDRGR